MVAVTHSRLQEAQAQGKIDMALTRQFKETVANRAAIDPEFRRGLLESAIEAFLDDELAEGKILLRDYVNATIGFEKLAAKTGMNAKSLMRMLGSSGNPRADNLLSVIACLKEQEGLKLVLQPAQ
jgi:DNA-binding phage protein